MFFRIEPKDEPRCRELLQGFKLHLQSLEEQYPSALRRGLYGNLNPHVAEKEDESC